MPNKKAAGLAAALTATIVLLITIGLPGPAWLSAALGVAAVLELSALILTLKDRHA